MEIRWEEPVEFFQAYMRSTGSIPTQGGRVLAGIIAAAVVALLTYAFDWFFFLLHQKALGVPLYFYFVAPAISGVFVWLLPMMFLAIPATIVLNERGIYRNKALGSELSVEFWPWDSVSEMAIDKVQYDEETFRVLVVRGPFEEGELLMGLGDANVHDIAELARENGKTLETRA